MDLGTHFANHLGCFLILVDRLYPREKRQPKEVEFGNSPHRTSFSHYSHQYELQVAYYPQEWMEQQWEAVGYAIGYGLEKNLWN